MSKRFEIDEAVLIKLYVKQGLSAHQIAKRFDCWNTTILSHLRGYNIPIRKPKLPLYPDKSILFDLYINKKLSPYSIAPILKCEASTVRNWLLAYNFPIRKKNLIQISRKRLSYLYFDKKLSLKKIADLFGYTPSGIFGAFKKYGIKLRTTSQSSKYYFYRFDFDGDDSLKSYMIGFRIGDLHVREEKHLIRIGSGTTKKDQLVLISNLFKRYGKVYIGSKDGKGAWHPEVSLNQSFKFLLPKYRKVPNWIMKSNKNFQSFLAGYSDAEANIGCYPRARFKITSYDYGILKDIARGLKKYLNVSPVFFLEKTDRLRHNQDALSLIINERKQLYIFLRYLKLKLRHGKRRGDLTIAINNLKARLKNGYA